MNTLLESGATLEMQHLEQNDAVYALCLEALKYNKAKSGAILGYQVEHHVYDSVPAKEADHFRRLFQERFESSSKALLEHGAAFQATTEPSDTPWRILNRTDHLANWSLEGIIEHFSDTVESQQRIVHRLLGRRVPASLEAKETEGRGERTLSRVGGRISEFVHRGKDLIGRRKFLS